LEPETELDADDEALLDGGRSASQILSAVTEELAFRWRAASAGQFSPTNTRRSQSASEPVTQYAYLEKRLRKVDADGYAAAGLLPFVTLDDTEATADAIIAALSRASARSPPQQSERVLELLTPLKPHSSSGPAPVMPPLPQLAEAAKAESDAGPERRRPLENVHVLLARQGSLKKNRGLASTLSFLGGKRERSDSGPLATALREAREETSGLLGKTRLKSELLGPVLWFPQGRFALFLYSMPRSAYGRMRVPSSPATLRDTAGLARASKKVSGTEVVELQWLTITDVLAISRAKQLGVARFCRAVVTTPPLARFFINISRDAEAQREATAQMAADNVQAVREERQQKAANGQQ